MAHSASVD
jgi:hypothetical protein